MKHKLKILSLGGLLAVLPFMSVHAETQPKFIITPVTTASVSVLSNGFGTVQYRVTNNTGVTRSLTMAPLAGVTINTALTGTCSNPFTLAPNQSCVLNLQINGSQVPANGIHSGPVICKAKAANSVDPFLCSQPSQINVLNVTKTNNALPPFAYVSADATDLNRCPILPNGVIGSTCTLMPVTGATGLDGLVLNNAKNRLYVVDFPNNNVHNCVLNPSGLIGTCQDTPTDPSASLLAQPSSIVLNNSNTYGYMLNFNDNNNVIRCAINSSTGDFSTCIVALSGLAGDKEDFALNPTGTRAYIGTGSGSAGNVFVCQVSPTDGSFSNCVDAVAPGTFAQPYAIAVNSANTAAYIGNQDGGTLSVCYINQTNGTFTQCVDSGSPSTDPFWPQEITFNQSNTLLYYLNRDLGQAYRCMVNPITSTLQFCIPTTIPAGSSSSAGLAVTN